MALHASIASAPWFERLRQGVVIPAHPLALTEERRLDERHQKALTRYYLEAGAGGVAVGVHTTQFAIRDPQVGLHRPVLELAKATIDEFETNHPGPPVIRVAGICGKTRQAAAEAELARRLGYQVGLVSLGALRDEPHETLVVHLRALADIIPIMGFYLQPSVGGRLLDHRFWTAFCRLPNTCAVKIAPFNRYQTLDVLRAVAETGRSEDLALYTGNDDTILMDLLTCYEIPVEDRTVPLRFAGGLLGHWAVWTKRAVECLADIHAWHYFGSPIPPEWLTRAAQVTDCNAAFFDAAHDYHGCIAGIHEVLRRQGLMQGRWCLDEDEDLSPGQMEEIDRVYRAYPHLHDDAFVKENLDRWLA